jgi:hypothetical protein
MPDEKRNVGDGLASGVNPNVGYGTRRYVFLSFGFVASGFTPDEEKASGMNPDATGKQNTKKGRG